MRRSRSPSQGRIDLDRVAGAARGVPARRAPAEPGDSSSSTTRLTPEGTEPLPRPATVHDRKRAVLPEIDEAAIGLSAGGLRRPASDSATKQGTKRCAVRQADAAVRVTEVKEKVLPRPRRRLCQERGRSSRGWTLFARRFAEGSRLDGSRKTARALENAVRWTPALGEASIEGAEALVLRRWGRRSSTCASTCGGRASIPTSCRGDYPKMVEEMKPGAEKKVRRARSDRSGRREGRMGALRGGRGRRDRENRAAEPAPGAGRSGPCSSDGALDRSSSLMETRTLDS